MYQDIGAGASLLRTNLPFGMAVAEVVLDDPILGLALGDNWPFLRGPCVSATEVAYWAGYRVADFLNALDKASIHVVVLARIVPFSMAGPGEW